MVLGLLQSPFLICPICTPYMMHKLAQLIPGESTSCWALQMLTGWRLRCSLSALHQMCGCEPSSCAVGCAGCGRGFRGLLLQVPVPSRPPPCPGWHSPGGCLLPILPLPRAGPIGVTCRRRKLRRRKARYLGPRWARREAVGAAAARVQAGGCCPGRCGAAGAGGISPRWGSWGWGAARLALFWEIGSPIVGTLLLRT